MSILPLSKFPDDPVLRQKAKRVPAIDSSVLKLIDDMIETMQQSKGVGLAAPQVGISLRLIVLQMPGEEPFAMVNPEIVKKSGEQQVTEGCLSVPGYYGELKRADKVTAKGLDRNGKEIRVKATGLLAEALQHEIDHLNGVLYIDCIGETGKLYQFQNKTEQK
ncbi:MAG TPA: peptide deformylase [Dehalococcoidia bacterium]|nr:peptide deformylase [Dehalococcoidia bacterium]HAS27752.1 peptide deformylase [Dehalococcoidia bacterium]